MDESSLIRLDLRASLEYAPLPGLEPFAYGTTAARGAAAHEEQLFCFAINPAQSQSIEPERELFLDELLFAGASAVTGKEKNGERLPNAPLAAVRLPAGLYLFTQRRKALEREECIDLAIEQQKDGLWERAAIQDRLYVRYLFEDGKPVTQIFRPCHH